MCVTDGLPLCRFTVRPYKYDPAEEKAEKQKKTELAQKKKTLWVLT